MADVRRLLRNELASRNSNTNHSRKRKHDGALDVGRKRSRPDATSNADPATEESSNEYVGESPVSIAPGIPDQDSAHKPSPDPATPLIDDTTTQNEHNRRQEIDEGEWAAFDRDVVQPTKAPKGISAPIPTNGVVISANAISATELAQREQSEREYGDRDDREREAFEGDREDATRFMEEEFEEMDALDQRVKKLKRMREEIKKKSRGQERTPTEPQQAEASGLSASAEYEDVDDHPDEDDDGDDEEDDDWDDWRFRKT